MRSFLMKKNNGNFINPIVEVDNLHREMDQLFNLSLPGLISGGASLFEGRWMPAVDVVDEKTHLLVTVDLPGHDKDSISVSVDEHTLTIRGEKRQDKNVKQNDYLKTERYYGEFTRSLRLPVSVDTQKSKAMFKNGVLALRLAKKEECKPQEIKVDIE